MENYSVYEDIAERTNGEVYVGVVGPVRTGKSTFIKRFMETLVLPNAAEGERGVMLDELPQSAAGRTVMTTEPKFVPSKAAEVEVTKGARVRVRLVDCVGFAVDGASGFEENGAPRLVKTPWQEEAMPFEEAAELGTQKVIREHSTIGVVVTTDGSVTELSRESYERAEARAVEELKGIGKPFVVLLNCREPNAAQGLKKELEEKYGVPVVALNVERMGEGELLDVLKCALFEFPIARVDLRIPKWLQAFSADEPLVSVCLERVKAATEGMRRMRDATRLEKLFEEGEDFLNPEEIRMDLGTGKIEISVGVKDAVFYKAIGQVCDETIPDDLALMRYLRSLARVKGAYAKVEKALQEAEEYGYGIVYPTEADYELQKPKLVKKGAGYGVEFRARATGYHIVKVDVTGVVSPIIGTKRQGEEFVEDAIKAYDEGQERVFETSIFGKPLRLLVGEELSGKNDAMPVELRRKVRRTMTKIVNEGKNNLFCFLF